MPSLPEAPRPARPHTGRPHCPPRGRDGACVQAGGRVQSSLTHRADQSHAFLQVPGGKLRPSPLSEATEPKNGGAQHSGQSWGPRGPASSGVDPGHPLTEAGAWARLRVRPKAIGSKRGPGLLRDGRQGTPAGSSPCTWAPCWVRPTLSLRADPG